MAVLCSSLSANDTCTSYRCNHCVRGILSLCCMMANCLEGCWFCSSVPPKTCSWNYQSVNTNPVKLLFHPILSTSHFSTAQCNRVQTYCAGECGVVRCIGPQLHYSYCHLSQSSLGNQLKEGKSSSFPSCFSTLLANWNDFVYWWYFDSAIDIWHSNAYHNICAFLCFILTMKYV